MVVPDADSFSPSAGKPSLVVADWQDHRLPIEVSGFDPMDEAVLSLAHDPVYVRAVLGCETDNGFGNRSPEVAASLVFTCAAMLEAGREALRNRSVACAPVSGFHHAGYSAPDEFCTFNGLMVTALALKQEGLVNRVGILDLDYHWGNGTDEIRRHLRSHWIRHISPGRYGPKPSQAQPFLARLTEAVNGFRGFDLLLYQAGADAHVDDPLGGWMTNGQLAERDKIVFETAAAIGLPVAWNLAGGYQRDAQGGIAPVLAIHRRTMRACSQAWGLLGNAD